MIIDFVGSDRNDRITLDVLLSKTFYVESLPGSYVGDLPLSTFSADTERSYFMPNKIYARNVRSQRLSPADDANMVTSKD